MHVGTQQKAWPIITDHKLTVASNIEYGCAHSKGEETKDPASGIGL